MAIEATNEQRFESDIEAALLSPAGGYAKGAGSYNPSLGLYADTLIAFIQKTQPREWARFESGTKHVFSSRLLLIGQDGETVTSKEKDIKITIAQAILHKPSITKKELSEIMGVSTKTIERKLKEMGYSHSGARKKGQWEGPGTV